MVNFLNNLYAHVELPFSCFTMNPFNNRNDESFINEEKVYSWNLSQLHFYNSFAKIPLKKQDSK